MSEWHLGARLKRVPILIFSKKKNGNGNKHNNNHRYNHTKNGINIVVNKRRLGEKMCELHNGRNYSYYTTDYTVIYITHSASCLHFFSYFVFSFFPLHFFPFFSLFSVFSFFFSFFHFFPIFFYFFRCHELAHDNHNVCCNYDNGNANKSCLMSETSFWHSKA